MKEKDKPLIQIHLFTCIILMLVAAALLGANYQNRGPFLVGTRFDKEQGGSEIGSVWKIAQFRGWPFPVSRSSPIRTIHSKGRQNPPAMIHPWPGGINVLIGFLILILTGIAVEVWTRRHSRTKDQT